MGTKRLQIAIRGAVQGVGFRPFVYRLANDLNLAGWVCNTAEGVLIEAEGPSHLLESFLLRLDNDRPPLAHILSLEPTTLDPAGYSRFDILPSRGGTALALVLPDIATCGNCLAELFDPTDRRFRYPFINCTHCGPRFSIIERLPYDRPHTTMRSFTLCEACRDEYENPADRRFHAQPNACPDCGPHLSLRAPDGRTSHRRDDALLETTSALLRGEIVAVKGIGGFHLMVDATNGDAVARLRARKHREAKPLAVMVANVDEARRLCHVSSLEERLLRAPEAPIVLLDRRTSAPLTHDLVAPDNPTFGILLPTTPVHHLLLAAAGVPLVATSGNLSDEPICIDEEEALVRLGGIADRFLVHNRPILRHVDDSIVRVVLRRELVLRRARGYAPLPIPLPGPIPADRNCTLAVGAHLKNAVALGVGDQAFVSQHIGDLETVSAFDAFTRVGNDLQALYDCRADQIACDLHPDYLSTRFARDSGLPTIPVQHHYAHVLACMAENRIEPPVLGISWDGTGFGPDGTIWGGEFLLIGERDYRRFATLLPFPLPGGEKAVREPRRSALGALYTTFGDDAFAMVDLPPLRALTEPERRLLAHMLRRELQAPLTSSAGRLFDAVASLLSLRQISRYEGQAAMQLEYAALRSEPAPPFEFHLEPDSSGTWLVDWRPVVRALVDELRKGSDANVLAARFHGTLVDIVCTVASRAQTERIALTGGCFQNRLLTETTVTALENRGFRPYWHQRIPPNDGGICLGQLVAARRHPANPAVLPPSS